MKGFILAAGLGTRLWPLTEDRTKAAIPFLNRPLIGYSVDYLSSHGIRDIIVNLHHQPESIRQALGDGSILGVNVTYSFEEEILGTSGALDLAKDLLLDDDFVVINGKLVTDIDLTMVIAEHKARKALATLVLRENSAREHFSIVEIDERSWITRFAGFPDAASQAAIAETNSGTPGVRTITERAPLMFTGIQVLSPRIFDYVPVNCFSHSTIHVYPRAIAAGEPIIAYTAVENWYEMSTLKRYLEASLKFIAKTGGSVVADHRCTIADDASVEQAVVWEDATIESGARVRRAIIGGRVTIPANSVVENAVVVRREIVREIERGEVVGDNLIVPI